MASTILGIGSGKSRRNTTQLPAMINNMLNTGSCPGRRQWRDSMGQIHDQDLSMLFVCLCLHILEGTIKPSGEQVIYFTETGLFTHKEYSQYLANPSHKLGYLLSPTITEATLDEVAKGFTNGNRLTAELSYGANALTKSELGRILGWVPSTWTTLGKSHSRLSFKAL
ncbi:hypothetical protein BU25DRAFT_424934 [Macroventuria anomochaeta]|uniref:Uncharacterized protein n=1 Tax=Macroventuria anomochaeta TaxID=301207 RepID=A0ACB6RR79_9PLEO|nr:uncharacterized protein BU25DRAFT_424934 [Macroventuria anomochaeta]KAF2623424.1 hypothetical protein BU25DRAFT_424934 [Macroventuria anomochaeta]